MSLRIPIRLAKPPNPSKRFMSMPFFRGLSKPSLKNLTAIQPSWAGRNNSGKTTVRGRGGGHKRRYRIIDFHRKFTLEYFPNHFLRPVYLRHDEGKVIALEYDPNRNARIALLKYKNGVKEYIIAPRSIRKGMVLYSGFDAPFDNGNALPMEFLPLGFFVHNIELTLGKGGQLVRAAGTIAKLLAKKDNYVTLKLPSKEVRLIHKKCYATIGEVGNIYNKRLNIGKAGRNRWLGKRPKVRGVAKNPVDHPHGGGEAQTGTGRIPKTPWGKPTLFVKTRDPRFSRFSTKISSGLILQRPKKRRRRK